ncbi:4155_t:CDS:2 [Funneliformis geosporum]|uniref:4155_t:CDS:1 n=1 Tax=Funneliformis geosporum TaxID=1117311 RepID=A0A9W4SQN0_9GLOM|nr:4155_t:CDS:2 [Funneliformis geosporum]
MARPIVVLLKNTETKKANNYFIAARQYEEVRAESNGKAEIVRLMLALAPNKCGKNIFREASEQWHYSRQGEKILLLERSRKEEKEKQLIANQEKRIIQVGKSQTTIKEVYGGSKENPRGKGVQARGLLFKLVPEFTSVHPSTSRKFFETAQK